ncbi:hypothetical protein BC937DRAFT_88778 [Endogone sp. FLAS-F59071]|nr:hypothetical protein BC937DRAFT_88778 [Endogone sp. FLAS-F59071]|eukprot:RUS18441.1 hypothetical protein BC937DRAFT_88778 [Endogone sp. FLAS-F59071]
MAEDSTLANHLRPLTDSTITIRCIKSFEYRTCKNLILHDVNLVETTLGDLKNLILEKIKTTSGFKPFQNVPFDTLKLYTVAHGHKVKPDPDIAALTPDSYCGFEHLTEKCSIYYTMNLIINIADDENLLFTDDDMTLASLGLENESEVSFFNREAYEAFKQHPDMIKW